MTLRKQFPFSIKLLVSTKQEVYQVMSRNHYVTLLSDISIFVRGSWWGRRKSKNLWSGCEILANFSYNFHSELWTFGALILGSLNKKGPKSGKVTTMGTYFANLKVCDCDPLCSLFLHFTYYQAQVPIPKQRNLK